MKLDVCIVSNDRIYAQWIKLELIEKGKSVSVSDSLAFAPSAKLYIIDIDSVSLTPKGNSKIICFGKSEKPPKEKNLLYLVRPFTASELVNACEQAHAYTSRRSSSENEVSEQKNRIIYGGEEYFLTEKEFLLYSILRNADGEPVNRLSICKKLWGELDDNSLNLYIHYLRQKLEHNGTKAIRSHRGKGYSLIIRKDEN